jgi:hypothetical protein
MQIKFHAYALNVTCTWICNCYVVFFSSQWEVTVESVTLYGAPHGKDTKLLKLVGWQDEEGGELFRFPWNPVGYVH